MTGVIEAVDREKAALFQGLVMRLLSGYLMVNGVEQTTPDEVFNGTTNALCTMLKNLPDEKARVCLAAQCVRLLLDTAACLPSDVLDEVERQRPLARFIESEAMGRA